MIHIEKPSEERLDELQGRTWPVWTKEPSEFPWEYDETETCYLLDGEVVVTPENGSSVNFGKGDLVIFTRGLKCSWKIIRTVRKHYKFG